MGKLWGRNQFKKKKKNQTWTAAVLEEIFSDCLFSQNKKQLLLYSRKKAPRVGIRDIMEEALCNSDCKWYIWYTPKNFAITFKKYM